MTQAKAYTLSTAPMRVDETRQLSKEAERQLSYKDSLELLRDEFLLACGSEYLFEREIDVILRASEDLYKEQGSTLIDQCHKPHQSGENFINDMLSQLRGRQDVNDEVILYWVESLVNRGFDPSKNGILLHFAIEREQELVIEFLLQNKVDVNCLHEGGSVLLTCLGEDNLPLMEDLIQRGADVHWKDHEGWNVLHYAAANNQDDFIMPLLNHGLKLSDKTYEDLDPIAIAKARSAFNALALLESIHLAEQEKEELLKMTAPSQNNTGPGNDKERERKNVL